MSDKRAHAACAAAHRLHLPVLQPAPDAHRRGERRAAAGDRRPQARPRRASTRCSSAWASPTAATTGRRSSPAASSSASPSPARWSAGRPCCSPTSRPATSTPPPAPTCSTLLREAVDVDGQTTVDGHPRRRAPPRRADRVAVPRRRPRSSPTSPTRPRSRPRRDERGGAAMIRVALKGLAARPLRTALTTLAIVVGVAFGRAALHAHRHDARRGRRPVAAPPTTARTPSSSRKTAFTRVSDCDSRRRRRSRPRALDTRRAAPGVGVAVGDITDTDARSSAATASRVGNGPYFGVGFDAATPGRRAPHAVPPARRPLGDRPGPGRASTPATADEAGLRGRRHGPRRRPRRGRSFTRGRHRDVRRRQVARHGHGGAVFDLRAAQALFAKDGRYDRILVAGAPAPPPAELRAALAAALPHGVQVRDRARPRPLHARRRSRRSSGSSATVLLAFAGVAVLVGGFTIFNSLSITVAQRTREFGLLRMVGATRRQVLRRACCVEALAIGLLASRRRHRRRASALAAGLQRAVRRRWASELPAERALVARGAHGHRLAARRHARHACWRRLIPARRATRIAPVAALRDGGADGPRPGVVRPRRARRSPRVVGRPAAAPRRRGRPARPPQRDAQPRPHGRHRARADDRRRARDRGHRRRPGPQGQDVAARSSDRVAAERGRHRRRRLVADRPQGRAGVAPRPASGDVSASARTARSPSASRRASTPSTRRRSRGVFDYDWSHGRRAVLASLGDDGALVDDGLGRRSTAWTSASRSR